MRKIFGIEVTDEEFDYFYNEQEKSKDLKAIDGKVVAVEHKATEEELTQKEIYELEARLKELSQDIVQIQCGAVFEDEDERIVEFREKHNRLRYLKGKKPREYK